MPPFLQNLTDVSSLQELFAQGKISSMLMLAAGFYVFRRVALFSSMGLLPILMIVGLMFSRDAGVQKVLQDVGVNPSVLQQVDLGKWGTPAAVLAGLFVASRLFPMLRFTSMGTGLLIIGALFLLQGGQVNLPDSINTGQTSLLIFGLLIILVTWPFIKAIWWRYNMTAYVKSQAKLERLKLKEQLKTQKEVLEAQALANLAAANPQAYFALQMQQKEKELADRVYRFRYFYYGLGLINIVCLMLLYFRPEYFHDLPFWRSRYGPYLFVLSLASMSFVVLRLNAKRE